MSQNAKANITLFTGGGFVFGNLETDAKACEEIQEKIGLKVIDVGYRLCPGIIHFQSSVFHLVNVEGHSIHVDLRLYVGSLISVSRPSG
jgi:acetyl esterase/lipase